jgi:hypothetical protein
VHPRRAAAGALLALLLVAPMAVRAQDSGESRPVHWALGTFLGTGIYRIGSDRTAFSLKIPGRFTVARSGLGANGERRIGLELRFPVTLGVLTGDSIADYIDQDVYGTVAFTPGLEAEIEVLRDWWLRPYLAFGWGTELGPVEEPDPTDPTTSSSQLTSALIYQVGLKSRVHVPIERGVWALLGAVEYAGYNPSHGASGDLLLVSGGFETRQRLGSLVRGSHALFWEGHALYSYVTDLDRLRNGPGEPVGIDDFVEVGLAVSQGAVPFRLFGLIPIERLGLAFQLSTDLEYRAIKLSFRSPFRR